MNLAMEGAGLQVGEGEIKCNGGSCGSRKGLTYLLLSFRTTSLCQKHNRLVFLGPKVS